MLLYSMYIQVQSVTDNKGEGAHTIYQCFGSGSGSGRIRIISPDPDPHQGNVDLDPGSKKNRIQINQNYKNIIFFFKSLILFNIRE